MGGHGSRGAARRRNQHRRNRPSTSSGWASQTNQFKNKKRKLREEDQ